MDYEPYQIHEADIRVIELLRDFIPQQVFDAHMHCYHRNFIPGFYGTGIYRKTEINPTDYLRDMKAFLPGVKRIRMNLIPNPDPSMAGIGSGARTRANDYIAEALQKYSDCTGSAYVLPGDDECAIDEMTSVPGIRAIKCYCYGKNGDHNWEMSTIDSFLPESAWVVANQKRLPIILHMMRPAALSDSANLNYIANMTRRYPNARLVLAHCARGFAAWTVLNRIDVLAGIDNIWFDLAAICEDSPMAACVMRTAGKRVVWGSDYPICMYRGRTVSLADGQFWLFDEELKNLKPQGAQPCLIAGENLLALRRTALLLRLDQTQLEDIFYNNAVRLFGLEK